MECYWPETAGLWLCKPILLKSTASFAALIPAVALMGPSCVVSEFFPCQWTTRPSIQFINPLIHLSIHLSIQFIHPLIHLFTSWPFQRCLRELGPHREVCAALSPAGPWVWLRVSYWFTSFVRSRGSAGPRGLGAEKLPSLLCTESVMRPFLHRHLHKPVILHLRNSNDQYCIITQFGHIRRVEWWAFMAYSFLNTSGIEWIINCITVCNCHVLCTDLAERRLRIRIQSLFHPCTICWVRKHTHLSMLVFRRKPRRLFSKHAPTLGRIFKESKNLVMAANHSVSKPFCRWEKVVFRPCRHGYRIFTSSHSGYVTQSN